MPAQPIPADELRAAVDAVRPWLAGEAGQPARSTSSHAFSPGGFLKVEPPVLLRSGCDASRLAAMRSISAWIAAGSPGVPRKVAATTIAPSGSAEWR